MSHLGCNRAQWIYSIIFVDLLTTIIEPGSTTLVAWTRFPDLFQDNKNAHVVTLEREFSGVCMENLPNVSAYCQRLKIIFDLL